MIRIHHSEDAAAVADAFAVGLRGAYPELGVRMHPAGEAGLPPAVAPVTAWDDLLILVFGTDELPAASLDAVARELDRAGAEHRAPRILPVSASADRPVPPPPMNEIKALPCAGPSDAELERIIRRTGALLGLWTRGQDKKIFVSYRAADGIEVAEQVTAFLKGQGYQALRDEEWLQGGELVQPEIVRRLASASLVLLLDTPRASESDWIRQEIDGAIEHFLPILPAVLRPADDRRKGPRFRALKELDRWVDLPAELDADGVCRQLTADHLEVLLAEMEDYLSDVLRTQMMLPALAGDSFRRAGFDWSPRPELTGMFETSKADAGFAAIRVLAYCSPLPPTFHLAVDELKRFPREAAGLVDNPLRYNYRIFLHDAVIPAPELQSIAEAVGLGQEAQLRVLDPLGLEFFLRRFCHPAGESA